MRTAHVSTEPSANRSKHVQALNSTDFECRMKFIATEDSFLTIN